MFCQELLTKMAISSSGIPSPRLLAERPAPRATPVGVGPPGWEHRGPPRATCRLRSEGLFHGGLGGQPAGALPTVYNNPVLTPPKISGNFTVPKGATGKRTVTVTYVAQLLGFNLTNSATPPLNVR